MKYEAAQKLAGEILQHLDTLPSHLGMAELDDLAVRVRPLKPWMGLPKLGGEQRPLDGHLKTLLDRVAAVTRASQALYQAEHAVWIQRLLSRNDRR